MRIFFCVLLLLIFGGNISYIHAQIKCNCDIGCGKYIDTMQHKGSRSSGIVCSCGKDCACVRQMQGMTHGGHQSSNRHPYLLMMDSMMSEMDTAPVTDTLERNFLVQMIPHHRGAVSMARYQLAHGRDPEMVQLAKSILAEQSYEIGEMEHMLSVPPGKYVSVNPKEYRESMDQVMMAMMERMPAGTALTDSVDMSFAAVMSPHHQAAIDMCISLLGFHPSRPLSILAENIIASQQVELEQMNTYLKKTENITNNNR